MEQDAAGARRFEADEVVARYAESAAGLTVAEDRLLDRWSPASPSVLDLGIGTGRTTAALRARASSYVGIDLATAMVEVARRRHPDADLRVHDASDLTPFADASIDVVLWSYNGLDYLAVPRRAASLRECRRVLRPGGVVLVSSHDPRAVLVPPSSLDGPGPRRAALSVLVLARRLWGASRSGALWRGRGWVHEAMWDGLGTYAVTPRRMRADLAGAGLEVVEVVAGDAPRPGRAGRTPWWYYAAVPASGTTPRSR